MNKRQLNLLSCVIEHIAKDVELSRQLVSDCYYATKPKHSVEDDRAAEAWINVFWEGCKQIPPQEFTEAEHSRQRMADLLHKILT